jgi:hypothetical protein
MLGQIIRKPEEVRGSVVALLRGSRPVRGQIQEW